MEIVEIWQNLKKKRNTDYDFPPSYVGGKKQVIGSALKKQKSHPISNKEPLLDFMLDLVTIIAKLTIDTELN